MRRSHTGRMLGAAIAASVTVLGLSACFVPMPPPVPQAPNADPIVPVADGDADMREGFIGGDATTTLELQIEERSAVVLSAGSTEGEDLTMRLVGEGVDLENDDRDFEPSGLAFEAAWRDPLISAVLEPGSYSVELAEYGGDATEFQLQVLASSMVVGAGESIDLAVSPGEPAVVIVALTTGRESISAVADFDSMLWAQAVGFETPYSDDDSGGDRNPRISLVGEEPQDIVVIASSYGGDDTGTVLLSVE